MADPLIKEGIPLRVGATRCVLGTLRDSPDVVEATENTIDHDDVAGCSARNPEHGVTYTDDENGDPRYTAMTPYSTYPSKLPTSTDDEDTHLVIKARGQLERDEDGTWMFPKVKLTLRPLFTHLDYKWISDAVADGNLDSVTNFGGGYEENANGESVWMDFDFMHSYQAPTLSDEAEDFSERYDYEKDRMETFYVERGLPIYLEGDFYYKYSDKPANLPAYHAPPLQPWEIDLSLYPRAEGEKAYEFKIHESWDLRYRYPSWYPSYGGSPYHTANQQYPRGVWLYTPPATSPLTNPFSKPEGAAGNNSIYKKGIPNTLVPVEKYVRIQEGSVSLFPMVTPNSDYQNSGQPELWRLHQSKALQVVSKVRKRYPFSFDAFANATGSRSFRVFDNNPANRWFYLEDPEVPDVFQAYIMSGQTIFRGTDPDYYPDALDGVEKYKCESWWRMEIETEACEWNFDELLGKGWTIKGKIKFGKKFLDIFSIDQGAVKGYAPFNYFYSNGFISPTQGVYPNAAFGFYRPEDSKLDADAGEAEFTVKISKDNATGSPVKVLDFPIGGVTYIPNEAGDGFTPVYWGDRTERSINFIRDFYITQIIPPQ